VDLPVNIDLDQSEGKSLQASLYVYLRFRLPKTSGLEKKIKKNTIYVQTNFTARIDKDCQNRFIATLNFPKI